jgi:4-alpha-glucanotransferase
MERSAGLLLHVTSLPGGRLGPEAYEFLDFCAAAGQRWWQMLPVHPPGRGDSPYHALSAFAGSAKLLADEPLDPTGFARFRRKAEDWLPDYALFRALRDAHGGAPWPKWPRAVRDRTPRGLKRAREQYATLIERYEREQFAFAQQWAALRRHARERGVGLIGDLPLFVSHDSADVWANRSLFKLTKTGRPRVVAGVPPDYFSKTGQRWGNPLYRWSVMKRRRYAWWIARLRRLFELFDVVRIDHFLGILRAWEIPARAKTGLRGRWTKGPGAEFLQAVRRALPRRKLIAEDLGRLTPEAAALRDRFRLPGMRVLHFTFGPDPETYPHAFPRNCIVYTGTHDNDTTAGWARTNPIDSKRAQRYAGCTKRELSWGLIRVAHLSPADVAIVPVQDLLNLGPTARMNTPGTTKGNWKWRMRRGALNRRVARKLRDLTEIAGR